MMKENLLKKILLFSTVGMALTGCVSETHVSTEESNKQITFEVAKYKPTTRVMAIIPIDEFGTFAYKKKNGEAEHTTLMDNIKIKHYSAGYWAAEDENAYMWEANTHIDFISYSPYKSDVNDPAVPKISDNGTGSKNQLKYEGVTVDEHNQNDLLYSDKAVCQTHNITNGYTGVPTLFRHALARLNFSVKASCSSNYEVTSETAALRRYWQVKVTSIKIDNIYKKGDVTLLLEDDSHNSMTTKRWNNANTTNNVWTHVTEGEDATCQKEWTAAGNGQELTISAAPFGLGYIEAKNYYVLPQVLESNKQKITVKYVVSTSTSADGPWVAGVEQIGEMDFYDLTVAAWEMGKSITYTIEIDPTREAIHFAPSVDGWDTSGTGTSNDIKF